MLASLPNASSNLVRALLVSSAEPPVEACKLLRDPKRIMQLCGYGKPDTDTALASTDQRVVLIAEESLPADTFHIFEVSLPHEFIQTRGERSIEVTLAFDPPVRNSRLDYVGTTMDFRMVRGLELDRVFDVFSRAPKGATTIPRLPEAADCQMDLSTVKERLRDERR